MSQKLALKDLLVDIRSCDYCEPHLPLGPNPVVRASASARLLIIGQAPGSKVHASGIPWNDPSGERLRSWLAVDKDTFYDESRLAIVPMGFCYPGKGSSGDLPPRPECAERWHKALLDKMPNVELTLLVGSYAQNYYLGKSKETLTQRVSRWRDFYPRYIPTPHPSPRNTLWLKRNPWFEEEVVPEIQDRVKALF